MGLAKEPNRTPGPSEFGHGEGLRPRHLEDKPPAEGGMYRGTTPPVPLPKSG